ncbi:hypothetical protein KC274_14845, partial [Listeria monocytogenes]|nr:hypothetical protein [Listeria monocytogenes]
TRREIRKIVDLRIGEIQKRLYDNDRNVTIQVTEEAKDYLGNAGYSPAYGARPLARLIEKEVLNKMAVLILRGAIQNGESARVVLVGNKLQVLANHSDSELGSDDDMIFDDEDAVEELAP